MTPTGPRAVLAVPAVLASAAAASWAANCAVGLAAWRGRRGSRWPHHALYVSTCTATLLALVASAFLGRSRTTTALLAPALLPLVVVPRVRAGGRGHVLLAASLAPPLLGATAAAWAVAGGALTVELLDAIRRRRTTNGAFLPDPVSAEHQRLLVEVAGRAPSQLNSQPWRFVLVEDRSTIEQVAAISGESMTTAMSNGTFFERYKRYFRFSAAEMAQHRSGMLFDRLPAPLRPFTGQVFTRRGQKLMNALRVPQTLGEENRRLVAGSPLLLAALLDKAEHRPGELSAFYSLFSLGAAVENIWLTTVELGLGIQFVSFPMEVPGAWERVEALLEVPDHLDLMAVYRIGHVPPDQRRPAIDWSSSERRAPSQYVYRETCSTPQTGWDD